MPITIASLDEALTIAQNFDYIISLTDPSQRMKSFGDNHIHVKFPDTTHPTDLEYMKMYSGVLQVINWVKRNKLTPEHKILVHCHAGISRSSAMAWTLKVMFGETDYRRLLIASRRTVLISGQILRSLPLQMKSLVWRASFPRWERMLMLKLPLSGPLPTFDFSKSFNYFQRI